MLLRLPEILAHFIVLLVLFPLSLLSFYNGLCLCGLGIITIIIVIIIKKRDGSTRRE